MLKTKLLARLSIAIALAVPASSQFLLRLDQNGQSSTLANGGVLTLNSPAVGQAVAATVTLTYVGASVATFGSAPQIFGSGGFTVLSPGVVTLSPAQSTSLTLQFTPQQTSVSQSVLTWLYKEQGSDNYEVITLNLSGTVEGITVSSIQSNGNYVVVPAGGRFSFPDTPINASSDIIIAITNRGSGTGIVNSISVSGDAYQLLGLPLLPVTLSAGAELRVTARFLPKSVGVQTGSLQISSDGGSYSAALQGTAITSPGIVVSSVQSNGNYVVVPDGGRFSFPDTLVNVASDIVIAITNRGSGTATLNSIVVSGDTYQLLGLPLLPAALSAGAEMRITVRFLPKLVGIQSGSFQILTDGGSYSAALQGSAVNSFFEYEFNGASGLQQPFSQPAIGLSLTAPYSVDLRGTLTLTAATNYFTADPAVQFSSGGTKVSFTIPAGTLAAVFPSGSTQIMIQTGTVAELISITPSFSSSSGTDLTPTSPTTLQIEIPRQAPTLLEASIGSITATGFTLNITGFSTTRSLDHLTIQFQGASRVSIPAATTTIDVSTAAAFWFASSNSQTLGGLFSIDIPFSISVSGASSSANSRLAAFIAGISITATNEVGTSNQLQASLI
jgi:hypothetical protein